MHADVPPEGLGPWNPGLESTLPEQFLPLSTIYSAANVSSDLAETRQLSHFSGLPMQRLTVFRPQRLMLHEMLIRVMADLSVPDGNKYEDLGITSRHMTELLIDRYITPLLPELARTHAEVVAAAVAFVNEAQAAASAPDDAPRGHGWPSFWNKSSATRKPAVESPEARDLESVSAWRTLAQASETPFERACYHALATTGEAILGRNGRLPRNRGLITTLAVRLVSNSYGSLVIGEHLDPHFREAVLAEHFRFLPIQTQPIVMNVKGASASGKSTMRPLQKQLATRIGVDWSDFALISPDIWRKYLLDYRALGAASRYAGTLTGHEIEIIDRKLDLFMSHKAKQGRMSHLLIDRFRFDSFAQEPDEEAGSQLLTRFGDEVFMFFMITAPDATVERAWLRGEQFGRYKAVDDLLAHNVEAYSGIPGLFFTWALKAGKRVHYEFLDNSVAEGRRPRTVAFGLNGRMTILDIKCLLDIERFKVINIDARTPAEVYRRSVGTPQTDTTSFLRQCVQRIPLIDFANQQTGRIFAHIENGKPLWCDQDLFEASVPDHNVRAAFDAVVSSSLRPCGAATQIDARQTFTLGQWGEV